METPEEWHVVNLAGTFFQIDAATRKEIESFLRNSTSTTDFIVVETLAGEEVTVISDAVNCLFSSSPQQRAAARAFGELMAREESLG
jgi:hypothetical protein